jgi:ATP phosphoribosyltransferase regulatory subunit
MALSRKDEAELEDCLGRARAPHAEAIRALTRLQGGRDALVEGARLLAKTPAAEPAAQLVRLFDEASARGLGASLVADLGEVRGFAYYTGPIFHFYAAGPGDAVCSGGRYDELLARFGAPMAGAGFAIDLDRLTAALRSAGVVMQHPSRLVMVTSSDDARVTSLRARGVSVVTMPDKETALAWARAWGFSHVVEGDSAFDPATGAAIPWPADAANASKAGVV